MKFLTKKTIFFLLLVVAVYAGEKKELDKINSCILIEDYQTALTTSEEAFEKYKTDKSRFKYIECLALNGMEIKAIKELKKINENSYKNLTNETLENIAWAILDKASISSQYTTRLTTIIGAHLTQDVKAIKILQKALLDTNAIIRTVALQLASNYLDKPLKDSIRKLFEDEKIWLVRLEVIKAIGKMKIYDKKEDLQKIIENDKSGFEEKAVATEALVSLTEDINFDEIFNLSKSNKAGLRKLACELAAFFEVKQAKDLILDLLNDPIADVRVSALNAISMSYLNEFKDSKLKDLILKASKDPNPTVTITASYLGLIKNYTFCEKVIKEHIFSKDLENARFASSILAKTLTNLSLKKQILKSDLDIYVKANIALGLLKERKLVKEASEVLFVFLKIEDKFMLEERKNSLFSYVAPSYIRHIDQIPRYPEAIDQMTRLNILSLLAIVEEPRAYKAIESFLKEKGWGITGFASATLLKESDESAIDLIKQLLNEDEKQVKIQAALVLSIMAKEEGVVSFLQDQYKDSDYNMKIQILEALGHIGSKESIVFLVSILDEPYQNLRAVASSSLLKCINS